MLLSLCQRPVNVTIKASFTVNNRVLKIKTGLLEAQTSQCCLEAELKIDAKIQTVFLTHLDTALSKISQIVVIQGLPRLISSPHQNLGEAMVSRRAILV